MGRFSDFLMELVESTPQQELTAPEALQEPTLVGYNEEARDGDNDGIVQEGTPFERPASSKTTKKKVR